MQFSRFLSLIQKILSIYKTSISTEILIVPGFIVKIPEIDSVSGIYNCGSKTEYLAVLKVFQQTCASKADEIEKYYNEGNIADYTIKVHALKSSARIIGAAEISKLAEDLENAGNSGNISLIDNNTEKLLLLYRRLGEDLSPLNPQEEGSEPISTTELKEAYRTIGEIAQTMDFDLMSDLLEDLHQYSLPPEDAERLKKIESLLMNLDWDEIIETVSNL